MHFFFSCLTIGILGNSYNVFNNKVLTTQGVGHCLERTYYSQWLEWGEAGEDGEAQRDDGTARLTQEHRAKDTGLNGKDQKRPTQQRVHHDKCRS